MSPFFTWLYREKVIELIKWCDVLGNRFLFEFSNWSCLDTVMNLWTDYTDFRLTLKLKFSNYLQSAYLGSPCSSNEMAIFPGGKCQAWKWALVCTGAWTQERDPAFCESLWRVIRWQYAQICKYHTQLKAFLNNIRNRRDFWIWKCCTTDIPFNFLCGKQLHLTLSSEAWDSMGFVSKTCILIKYSSRHFGELTSRYFSHCKIFALAYRNDVHVWHNVQILLINCLQKKVINQILKSTAALLSSVQHYSACHFWLFKTANLSVIDKNKHVHEDWSKVSYANQIVHSKLSLQNTGKDILRNIEWESS